MIPSECVHGQGVDKACLHIPTSHTLWKLHWASQFAVNKGWSLWQHEKLSNEQHAEHYIYSHKM